MYEMSSAARDGRFVAVSVGGPGLVYAYFESGKWVAPLIVDKPELGSEIIKPIGWFPIQVPARKNEDGKGPGACPVPFYSGLMWRCQ